MKSNWTELNNWAVGRSSAGSCGNSEMCDWRTGRLPFVQTRARPSSADLQHAREKKTSRESSEAKREGGWSCKRGEEHTHTHTRVLTEGHCVPALHEWSFLWVRVCVCVFVWSHTSANYAAVADHWIIHTYEHNVSDENASVCVLLYICESGPSKGFPGLSLFMFRETEREGQPMRASFHMSQ